MIIYIKLANKFNIIDKPNERSSHNYLTVRGGGIVWWIAAVIYSIYNLPQSIFFLSGITLISFISFWDDVSSLSNRIRIIVHFFAISILFHGLENFRIFPWWQIAIIYIFAVGILNAYNFMDGINGMTGSYSLVVLIAFQYVNFKIINFTTPDFINYAILASVVFLFFNFRKRAKCFAGDIGSMAISFWIISLLLQLIIETKSLIWILFLTVYGVDSVCTIIHRLFLHQNIFKAHRMHFFQVLTNERKIPQLIVSSGYAILQLVICFIIVSLYGKSQTIAWISGICMLTLCTLSYLLKFYKK